MAVVAVGWRLLFAPLIASLLGGHGQPFAAATNTDPFVIVFEVERLAGSGPSSGSFSVRVSPEWAPLGAERLKELVLASFYDGCRFFRVINNFMVQFGIHGDPSVSALWSNRKIKDDSRKPEVSNTRGKISFATSGTNTRTAQLFINFGDNHGLDGMGFTPVAEVVSGMDIVDRIYKVGEGAPGGPGPDQGLIQREGTSYLEKNFPKLTFIKSARIMSAPDPAATGILVGNAAPIGDIKPQMVQCELTTGSVTIEVHPEWAPIGARRFLDLVEARYFDECALFRAIPGFLVQFGISSSEKLRQLWANKPPLADDPLRPDVPMKLGTMAFAGSGKNSRTTQMWISFGGGDSGLGTRPWETPFAQVVGAVSLKAVQQISTVYGDTVDQGQIMQTGYKYLKQQFPKLDYIKSCSVMGSDEVGLAKTSALSGVKVVEEESSRLRRGGGSPFRSASTSELPVFMILFAAVAIVGLLLLACRYLLGQTASGKDVD